MAAFEAKLADPRAILHARHRRQPSETSAQSCFLWSSTASSARPRTRMCSAASPGRSFSISRGGYTSKGGPGAIRPSASTSSRSFLLRQHQPHGHSGQDHQWSKNRQRRARSHHSLFHKAEELTRRDLDGAGGRDRLARTAVLVSLAEDDLVAAERWSDRIDDPFWGPISQARVHLAGGRGPEAVEAARLAEPRRQRHLVVREAGAGARRARPPAGPQVRGSGRRARRGARHAPDGRSGRRAGVDLVELAARRAPSAWMDRLRPSPRARPCPTSPVAGPGRGADQPGARRDAAPPHATHPPRDRLRALRLAEHAQVPPAGDLPEARANSRAEAVATARRLRLLLGALATLGTRERVAGRPFLVALELPADSTPRSTRCSNARSWSARRTAPGAVGSTGTASSTGRRRSRST